MGVATDSAAPHTDCPLKNQFNSHTKKKKIPSNCLEAFFPVEAALQISPSFTPPSTVSASSSDLNPPCVSAVLETRLCNESAFLMNDESGSDYTHTHNQKEIHSKKKCGGGPP